MENSVRSGFLKKWINLNLSAQLEAAIELDIATSFLCQKRRFSGRDLIAKDNISDS